MMISDLTPTARAGSGLKKCSKMKFSFTEPHPNSKIPLKTPPEIPETEILENGTGNFRP